MILIVCKFFFFQYSVYFAGTSLNRFNICVSCDSVWIQIKCGSANAPSIHFGSQWCLKHKPCAYILWVLLKTYHLVIFSAHNSEINKIFNSKALYMLDIITLHILKKCCMVLITYKEVLNNLICPRWYVLSATHILCVATTSIHAGLFQPPY